MPRSSPAGRRLLDKWSVLRHLGDRVLPRAERFFARHGGKAVFLARFFAGVRVTGAWMAGISRMPWWRFLAWNAAGGVTWAVAVGLVSYYAGTAAADAIGRYGLYGAIAVVALLAVGFVVLHVVRRRAAVDSA